MPIFLKLIFGVHISPIPTPELVIWGRNNILFQLQHGLCRKQDNYGNNNRKYEVIFLLNLCIQTLFTLASFFASS